MCHGSSPGDGWRFFASNDSAAGWIASLGPLTPGAIVGLQGLDAGLVIAATLVLAAPLAFVAAAWVYRRRPLVAPAAIFAAATVTAAMFAVVTGVFGNPASVTIAAPVLAAIVLTHVPVAPHRRPIVMLLLVAGFFGGAIGLTIIDPRATGQLGTALQGRIADQERVDALNLGGVTGGREGILVDSFNAPAVVLGRGHSSGLLLPSGETFAIAMLFARIATPFVAVPNPSSSIGATDRLNKAFPFLYRDGPPGYRLIYQNTTWRLFASSGAGAVYSN